MSDLSDPPDSSRRHSLVSYPFRLGPSTDGVIWSGFGGLAVVSNLSSAGDALVAVALAGSIFVSVPLNAARGRTALGLVCTVLPFVIVAPFLGPLADRLRAGHRLIIFVAALGRVAACVMIAIWLRSLLLFLAAFIFLVCSKTHAVARASLVPAVVDLPEALMRANAKLAVGSSLGSGAAAAIGAALYKLLGSEAVLVVASVLFAVTASLAIDLLPETRLAAAPAGEQPGTGRSRPPPAVARAGLAMAGLRAMAGFVTALVIFALRQQGAPVAWYGAVALAAVAANLGGALAAPRARRLGPERRLVAGSALLVCATAVAATQFPDLRRRLAALLVVGVLGFGASIAKTAFDAIVQREIPAAQRTTLFARLEGLFQVCWVLGALISTLVAIPLMPGFMVVAAVVLLSGTVMIVPLPGLRINKESNQTEGPEQPSIVSR
jgi:MFS family permease